MQQKKLKFQSAKVSKSQNGKVSESPSFKVTKSRAWSLSLRLGDPETLQLQNTTTLKRYKPKALLLFFLLCCTQLLIAQTTITPPQAFLGYAIGERFTPHHRVVQYAELVANQAPSRVKWLTYGQTYEGRPLVAVVLGNEANIARLDEIRTDNLKRAGLLPGKPSANAQVPISWLSYNVHGNEAVSSEAFMDVLYQLLDTKNAVSQKILNNSIVILDPDLNPDGHDRYVNWYNQMMGRTFDPSPAAREHQEPWPGGRFTHYYFDPNRDWAWQTQEITRQRMALYHKWMPQLHGDFHEMGIESPYYFAPSAKPFHEDITKFQRDFQNTIGQYCSRYFDRNGWLYYTRERFDLFYPSYGDTWPTYNGAIGMTYEQGGSGRAGLGVLKADGDTLTLRQRIDHHATASIATLESVADRPADVVKAFAEFFEKAQTNPVGAFKTYVVKNTGDAGKLNALKQLLALNQIRYGTAGKAQTVATGGFNYFTQQTEKTVSVAAEDLIISAFQPKSTLLKILFEPKSALEDSVTYDITAWSLPYAYGLPTYGLTSQLSVTGDQLSLSNKTQVTPEQKTENGKPKTVYAYLVRWQSLPSVQVLAGLLKQKVKVRAAEKSFELDGQSYDAGTLVVTRAGNERLGEHFDALVLAEAAKANIVATPVTTGFVSKGSDFGSDFVMQLKAPRIGALVGDATAPPAAGEVWHYFDQELNYPVTILNSGDFNANALSKLDVLVLPDGFGYGRLMTDKNLTVLKDWIRAGGKLIALEAAADALAGKADFELKEKDDKPEKDKADSKKKSATDSLKTYAERERVAVSDETPGSIYRLSLDTTHPLAFGLGKNYYALVQETHNFDLLKDGWNVGYLKADNYMAGFAGRNAKEKLKQTLSLGVQQLGRGQVVYLADDPLFRGFWYAGKLLFGNAVFMVGN
jgi:hypothetical protein